MSSPHNAMNTAQQEAVNFMHGPCLVLAGAGSGKTRVITHKIARLIQVGMPAQKIAAITFTNKAAAEMRERAKTLIGKEAQEVLICTFHALGVRMLRSHGSVLGLKPQFSILDTSDVTSILKDAGGSTDSATARNWQWTISAWKSAGLNAEQALAQAADEDQRQAAVIMGRYEERLSAYQSVDFDDLISLPLKLLREYPAVRAQWQAFAGHVLVDEYQDTNATQYAMLKLLVGCEPDGSLAPGRDAARFTAVGDDDQSIYGWRGATLDNLRLLPQDFPELKVIKLEQNYRSTAAILRAVTTPKRGIGHQTLGSLGTFASRYKLSLFEALFSSSLGSVLSSRAVGSLHEFGRAVNDLQFRAKHTEGAENALLFLKAWLSDIAYEKHLYDTEDSPQIAAVKWTNVMEFCDWMAQRCGGQMDDDILITQRASKNLLDVAQNIALLSTLTEREKDQNVVTLSTLHAAKGLEWPHVMLVGVTEGMLPFKMEEAGKASADKAGDEAPDDAAAALANADLVTRLQEERRLMYVGITRAQRTLSVSWTRRRKKGRDTIAAQPSRFIAEMALDKATIKEDPREKLRALRAEFAARTAAAAEKKPA